MFLHTSHCCLSSFVHLTPVLLLRNCPISWSVSLFILCSTQLPLALVLNRTPCCTDLMSAFFSCEVFRSVPHERCLTWQSMHRVLSTWTWHIVYFVAACECFWAWLILFSHGSDMRYRLNCEDLSSQETASSGEVRAGARSGLGRWRFWLLDRLTWSVWVGCQAKRKVLIYHCVSRAACRN